MLREVEGLDKPKAGAAAASARGRTPSRTAGATAAPLSQQHEQQKSSSGGQIATAGRRSSGGSEAPVVVRERAGQASAPAEGVLTAPIIHNPSSGGGEGAAASPEVAEETDHERGDSGSRSDELSAPAGASLVDTVASLLPVGHPGSMAIAGWLEEDGVQTAADLRELLLQHDTAAGKRVLVDFGVKEAWAEALVKGFWRNES